ncbi:MAG: ribonucleotide-diphosphate reductase subunit beta [Sedimenticolaceae bacterium]
MMNWDDPLAPISQATEAPNPAANPVIAEAAKKPAAAEPQKQLDIRPVNAEDKRVINGMTDINQLAPFKYPWAWEYFLNANRNHWTPLDINMAQDVHDYHHKLTLEERHVYENVLSYLTTSDILAMRNIGLGNGEDVGARAADLPGSPGLRRVTAYLDLPALHRDPWPEPG